MEKIFNFRSLLIHLTIVIVISIVVLNFIIQTFLQQNSTYFVNRNLTFSKNLLSSSVNNTEPPNPNIYFQDNMTIDVQNKEIHFIEWKFENDHDLKVAEKLLEISDNVKVPDIDCNALFTGVSVDKAKISTKANRRDSPLNDTVYVNLTEDCERFRSSRGYIMSSLTKEEEEFPIAFSMIVYKDVEMVERLLRAIYRPQNYYCVHVDKKSPETFYKSISAIAGCFPNVFIASQRIDVKWGTFTVLEPELLCMRDLWKYPKWKYFINLTGQEFPLKTNHEIVKILTAYRGACDIATSFKCAQSERWKGTVPPFGLRPVKGNVHIFVNRLYVDFVLHNKTAKAILNWVRMTNIPDETYFATLNSNPQLGIKGTYTGTLDSCSAKPSMLRYKVWKNYFKSCAGRFVREICILTKGDLPRLAQAKYLFANKFYLHEDRTVIGCLEEKIFNDTRDEYLGLKIFDASFYSTLDFVINQVM